MPSSSNPEQKVNLPARDHGVLTTEFVVPEWKLVLIHAAIILAAGLWIYWPALNGGWIGDDGIYLSNNPLLNDPLRLWKAWFQPGSFIEYYPLEQTVQWVQWQMWGNDTLGYHLTSVGLHLLSAFLIWRLLSKFDLRLAWLGGLIFTIHPMMVESVAWISELKNTLSLPPLLLSICAWIDYEKSGRRSDYLRSLAFFLASMLCKIGAAPFPAIILLYAWWKRGRIGGRDAWACVPFMVIAVALVLLSTWSSAAYVHAQMHNPSVAHLGGFFFRFALVGQTLSFYFVKCFWPLGPLALYPQWEVNPSSPLQFVPWLVLAGLAYVLWRKRQAWGRHAVLGLGFFVLNLSPFLGFISISYMSFTWVMDHFLYVPIIGIIGLVVAGIEDIDVRLARNVHPFTSGLLTVLMGLMALESHWYASAFTSEETFWTYVVDRNPGAWSAQDGLGNVFLQAGEQEKAKGYFRAAISLKPDVTVPYCDLATAYMQLRQIPEATEALRQALKIDPLDPTLHNNLGIMLDATGQVAAALDEFKEAVRLHPLYADAHNDAGHALLQLGRTTEAIDELQAGIKLDPHNFSARDDLGTALSQVGRNPEAMEQFQWALSLNPGDNTAQDGLAKLRQNQVRPGITPQH